MCPSIRALLIPGLCIAVAGCSDVGTGAIEFAAAPRHEWTLDGSGAGRVGREVAAEAEATSCPAVSWSRPLKFFEDDLRLASGNGLHAIGTNGPNVYHRFSADEGTSWSDPVRIDHAGRVPLYGPLATEGMNVYLLTRASGGLQVQRSTDQGRTWSAPILLHGYAADAADRVQLAAEGTSLHIFVGRAGAVPDHSFKVYYWRSTDAASSFENNGVARILDDSSQEPPSPGGIAVEDGIVHIGYAAITRTGTLGHRARYLRSTDNGRTWSGPVDVSGPGNNPQIRPRPRVLDGRVFILWEEPLNHDPSRPYPNASRSEIRTNISPDKGRTWLGPEAVTHLPDAYANHPEVAVGPGSSVHVIYRLSANQARMTKSDPIGHRGSPDYGSTWCPHEIGISDPARETHPFNLVSTDRYLHVASADGVYARRPLR